MSDFSAFVSNIIDIDTQIYEHWLNGIGVHQAVLKQYSRQSEQTNFFPHTSSPVITSTTSLPVDELRTSSQFLPHPYPYASNISFSSLSAHTRTPSSSSSTSTSSSSTSSSLSTTYRFLSGEKSFLPNVITGVRRAMGTVVDNWITYQPFTNANASGTQPHRSNPGSRSTTTTCTVDPRLNLHVITQYRWFTCIEPHLHRPSTLDHAIVFKLSTNTRQALIDGYYNFDDILMREIVGRKLTAKLRRELDEGWIPNVSVTSARRQFDNLKRILKKTEESELGADSIENYFKLSSNLVSRYANILFLYRHKMDMHKRKLSYLTYGDIDRCMSSCRLLRTFDLPSLKMEDADSGKLRFIKNFQSILYKESFKNIFLEVHEKLVEMIFGMGWTFTEIESFIADLKQEFQGLDVIDHLGNIVLIMFKAFTAAKLKKTVLFTSKSSSAVNENANNNLE